MAMVSGVTQARFSSHDGSTLGYQTAGDGPLIVLANGLGGTYVAFRHLYEALGERYRVLCWDYRGLYRSTQPGPTGDLGIPVHSRDLVALLDHVGAARAVVVGWSMGVQVGLEVLRDHQHRVAGFVAINGTYGTPFRTLLASRAMRHVVPPLLALLEANARAASIVTRHAVDWQGLVPMLRRFKLVGPGADEALLAEVAAGLRNADFAVLSELLRRLGEHDARDLLDTIDVPTLIVTGDRDLLTPVFTARKMNRRIKGSRLVILEGATHYTPIERPVEIARELLAFLAGVRGWEPSRPAGSRVAA